MRPFPPLAIACLALLAAACSGGGSATPPPSIVPGSAPPTPTAIPGWPEPGRASVSGPLPVISTSQLVRGPSRFLFTLVDPATNEPVAAPDLHTEVAFFELAVDPTTPVSTERPRFIWAIEGERGFYATSVTFPAAGMWGAEIRSQRPSEPPEAARVRFDVRESGTTPAIGGEAPRTDTPTAADVGGDLARLSTDPEPDPRFYELSVADAIDQGRPFVLVFATPAFCASRTCGPTLEVVKSVAPEHPDTAFINVEPYELEYADGRLQPAGGQLKPVAAALEWGIPVEPWIFVVDGDGRVRASFEAVVSPDELREAITAVGG